MSTNANNLMLRVITDFDGPIIDVSERYYRVYQFCLAESKRSGQTVNQLTKSEFWQLKRSRIPERKIGMISGLDQEQSHQFARLRRQTIHSLPYLIYDCLLPNVQAALEQLSQENVDLVLMTMRRVRELDAALNRFDLSRFFPADRRYCLTNNYVKSTDVDDKTQLMKQALEDLPLAADVWMIGDTEADIVAAKAHNIKVIGVLSGIRDRLQLEQYEPTFIVNHFAEAVDLVISRATV